jgi:tetrapyrrole methylase family protein/MazG family protein
LDEVSRGLPPLDSTWKLQKKAAKAGFDWPDAAGVIAKVKEELQETEAAIADAASTANNTDLEGELGDLLFSVVNLCRFFSIEPSVALQRTNIKFTERFKYVEKRMKETSQEMSSQNLDVMDKYWNEAKEGN